MSSLQQSYLPRLKGTREYLATSCWTCTIMEPYSKAQFRIECDVPHVKSAANRKHKTVVLRATRHNHVTGDFSHFHRESSNRSFETLNCGVPHQIHPNYHRPCKVLLRETSCDHGFITAVLGTDPSSCILDAFRTAIAKRVSERTTQHTQTPQSCWQRSVSKTT
jgi:hypothetical protein